MTVIEKYQELYHRDPEYTFFTPYRVCPLGAHSDHQYGRITGIAIDKGIRIAYRPKQNGVIELNSLQFDKRAQWHVNQVEETKVGDWADYLRGATLILKSKYALNVGMSAVIGGELPIGGLSSSAAITLTFTKCLCELNNIHLSDVELIMVALRAENEYVGVSCGKMDMSCEVFCRKDNLLFLDTKDDSYELIPTNPNMKPYEIAVFFSGLEHSLAGSAFNMRVDECRSAGYALLAYAGLPYGKFGETYLRNVPREVFEQYKDRLPENWAKRATHWYTEYDRVTRGVEAWKKGDIETFGQMSFESGHSSIYNWETGSPELKKLYDILCDTKGVYGGRFSGAGFKGCSVALIDPAYREDIMAKVEREYMAAFPELAPKYSACICKSVDGIGSGK